MKIFAELKRVIAALEPFKGKWCICGGIAASIYGKDGRFTNDIDIALVDTPSGSARDIAENVLKTLGYDATLGFIQDPIGAKDKQVLGLIVGRTSQDEAFAGIDFLLPIFPWLELAVARAQSAIIDYGFAQLPTIQPEDLIIAKLFALRTAPERGVDLLDISSIVESGLNLDFEYLHRRILKFKLKVPVQLVGRFFRGNQPPE